MYWLSMHGLGAVAFVAYGLAAARWQLWPETRGGVVAAGAAWVILGTAEFWIAGPFSFALLDSDLQAMTLRAFVAGRRDGGLFSHALAGGNDVAAIAAHTGALVSLDDTLVLLPAWAANLVHKGSLFAVGFAGTYLLARRSAGVDRGVAFALAALFTMAHTRTVVMTWPHGLGFGLLPLGAYLLAGRLGRRLYWPGVAIFAVVNAVSSTPTHSNLALFTAIALAALALGGVRHVARTVPALLMVAAVLLANWSDGLYAKLLMAPYSLRGGGYAVAAGFEAWLGFLSSQLMFPAPGPILAVLTLLGLGVAGDPRWGRIAAAVVLAAAGGSLVQLVPWGGIGLGPLGGLQFRNMNMALACVGILAAAMALGGPDGDAGPARGGRGRVATALLMGFAAYGFVFYKAYAATNWLSEGGLSVLRGEEALRAAASEVKTPQRAVSIGFRLPLDLPAVTGFDTLDGADLSVNLRNAALFWTYGIDRSRALDLESGFVRLVLQNGDYRCCALYDLDRDIDVRYLRIANVGRVISLVPLSGGGLTEIEGRPEPRVPTRRGLPWRERLAGYLRDNLDAPAYRIYALADPLPRVFAASDVVAAPRGMAVAAFIALVGEKAPARAAVIRAEDDPDSLPARESLSVRSFELVRDGIDVAVSAPEGGVVLVNVPWLPFWQAETDGRPALIRPANGIHMAVAVPPGARRLTLRYERPILVGRFVK